MNQKSTTRCRQRLQSYLLLLVMTVLSLLASNSFAQTASTGCPNALKYESFESAISSFTDLSAGLPRNGSYQIVQNVSQGGGGGYLNVSPAVGNSFMLIHTSSSAASRLYYTNVNVVAGQTYSFCASIANSKTDPTSGFTVTLNAGNTVIATSTAVYGWNQICGTYIATTTGVIQFSIKDPDPSFRPSHFLSLDNICISPLTSTGKIGDFVWNDINNNGIQESGEAGIANVQVKLFSCANVLIATTTTNANGIYSFNNLTAGSYYVQFISPLGYTFSPSLLGGNTTKDSDADPVSGKTSCFTLASGATNITIDAGMSIKTTTGTASLGDFVWNDLNKNGIQNTGEAGIPNVTVTLTLPGGSTRTTTTNSLGYYSFTALAAGTYSVSFATPAGFISSPAHQGGDDTKDSDPVGGTVSVTLATGQANMTIDAGFYLLPTPPPATGCANAVKYESFENGTFGTNSGTDLVYGLPRNGSYEIVQNISQAGGGGYLNITPKVGNFFMLIHTSSNASNRLYYTNVNVVAGQTYSFCVNIANSKTDPAGGFTVTLNAGNTVIGTGVAVYGWTQICGSYTATTSGVVEFSVKDPNPSFGPSHFLSLDDICISQSVPTGRIGDFVWNDLNNNGIQDAGEQGIPNVTVELYSCANLLLATTTTAANGLYAFNSLYSGSYYVVFTLPSGYRFSAATQGSDGTKDSDANTVTGKTSCFTLNTGEINTTIDAGMYQPASLGDFVFNDINANGIQDAGETGISGVTVSLYNCTTNALIGSTTTSSTGAYSFSGLTPGSYYVIFTAPAGYSYSPANQGGDITKDSDADAVTGKTGCVTLTGGQTNNTVDAGLYQKAALGDFVFNDINANGIQDAGETGIPNVTVSLYNCTTNALIGSTTTTTTGAYSFSGLTPGSYYVIFTAPAGYSFSSASQGGDITKDSDADVVTGKTACVTLTGGQTNNTVDAGLYQKATLGDFVFNDVNANGIQDAGETGISGVTVSLYNCTTNALISNTTTNTTGAYSFSGLTPGSYYVIFTAPPGYSFSSANQGGDITKDSDADAVTGKTACVTLTGGQTNNTVDAGLYQKATLGDFVFNDLNANGIQDAGETGISGVTVSLYDCTTNALIGSTTTNTTGAYSFSGLTPGSYYVIFTAPSGYSFSSANQGGDITKDSDADAVTGKTACVTLTGGQTNNTVDAGLYQKATLGDFVFNDANANGIQDAGETGIPNVTVSLYNCTTNALIGSTTTNTTGAYSFSGLIPGSFYVIFTAPAGYSYSPANQGGDITKDSDADAVTGKTGCVTLTGGQTNNTVDAGLYQKATLGDFVFNDANANGIQDAGETGIPNITVTLYDCATNALISSTTTNTTGAYSFSGLTPGSYYVIFTAPAGYSFSLANQGGDITKDSDADAVTGKTACVTLTGGQTNNTVDAGLYQKATLGDFVFNDANANGIQDAGETGISGVTVSLYDCTTNALIGSTTTNTTGAYSFSGLIPGSFYVIFTAPAGYSFSLANQGGDITKDSDADAVTGKTACVTLTGGQTNNTVDAGLYQKATLGDFVFNDLNANGIQDEGETGIPNVTVSLYNCTTNALIGSTTTSSTGAYSFSGLTPGSYYVIFTAPSGYSFSSANQGGDITKDSDADAVTGKTGCVTLTGGQTNNTVDAGLYQKAALGDFVWHDLNANGIQDAGEPGKSGVTVTLTMPNGTTQSTVTNASGYYLFANLMPGTYSVTFVTPSGFFASPSNAGPDRTIDSDPVGGVVNGIVLVSGQSNLTIDAGFYCSVNNLGDFVWYDQNNNGVQDAGEPGIAGATVRLYSDANGDNLPDGAAIATTTTSSTGIYVFNSLIPRKYIVGVVIPSGYKVAATTATSATPDNDVLNDNNGVNLVSGEIRSNYISLAALSEPTNDGDGNNGNLTLDFGLTGTGSIGDFVWHDLNANGLQDAGDPGKSGVSVTLTMPNGTTQSTVTNASGYYLFANLMPGTYSVNFVTPGGFFPSVSNAGTDRTIDSDPVGGVVTGIVLAAGQNNLTIDAGFYCGVLTVGNFVWYDQNNNGLQDTGEPGISGVAVKLYADANGDNLPDGAAIATTTTSSTGIYSFSSLTPGKYIVGVVIPTGYKIGVTTTTSSLPDNDVLNDNNGLNLVSGEIRSNYISLAALSEPTNDGDGNNGNLTLDFGLSCQPVARGVNIVASPVSYAGFNITGVYPNPFIDRIQISYTSGKDEKVTIVILDNSGRRTYNAQASVIKGKNTLQLENLGKLSAGNYTIQLLSTAKTYTQSMVK